MAAQIGGGTGYNIEQMGKFVDIPSLFEAVYLVDLSPSLCQVAVDRFTRLGWKNVHVVCQDARHFRLDDHQSMNLLRDKYDGGVKAECITMSYSLSMIPEFYPVVDSISSLLSLNGIMGVADFYVQSEIEYGSRNYIGGEIGRHCIWVSRVFWRTWFEADRVSLEAARRVSLTPQNELISLPITATGLSRIQVRHYSELQRKMQHVWFPYSLLCLARMLEGVWLGAKKARANERGGNGISIHGRPRLVQNHTTAITGVFST